MLDRSCFTMFPKVSGPCNKLLLQCHYSSWTMLRYVSRMKGFDKEASFRENEEIVIEMGEHNVLLPSGELTDRVKNTYYKEVKWILQDPNYAKRLMALGLGAILFLYTVLMGLLFWS